MTTVEGITKRDLAHEYAGHGIATTPCTGKAPINDGWQDAPFPDEGQIDRDFPDESRNIGGRTGTISKRWGDVDIDNRTTATLARAILPQTPFRFGRDSNPNSHYGYRIEGDGPIESEVFFGPDGKHIVNIRADRSQTILPGSNHSPTGEPIRWEPGCGPDALPVIAWETLHRQASLLAATTIIAEAFRDHKGSRHDIALPLIGLLATRGLSRDTADKIIQVTARASGADEVDLSKIVESTYDRQDEGGNLTAGKTLKGLIGGKAVRLICKYLNLDIPDDRAVVNLDIDDVNTIGDRVLAALYEVGTGFYTGVDGSLSRVVETPEGQHEIRPHTDDQLREQIGRHVRCQRPGRVTKADPNPDPVTANLPMDVVRNIQGRIDSRFAYLRRISTAPEVAANGTIYGHAGYNPLIRCFLPFTDEWVHFLNSYRLSLRPEPKDLKAAVDVIRELLCDFPFTSDADFAHAVALLLAPFGRELTPGRIPVFLFDKPEPGTGATLLVEVLTSPYYGPGGLIPTPEPESEAEWTKTLIARGLAGNRGFFLDNLRNALDSAVMSSAITKDSLDGRLLGTNKTIRVPTPDIWAVTANNAAISTEMARRILRVRIDAHMDRPFERTGFTHKLPEWANETRFRLIEAALLIWRAWVWEGRPKGTVSLGSFDDWAKTMSGVLTVVGIPGFLDNADAFYESADVEGKAWRAVVDAWWDRFGSDPVTARDLFGLPVVTETLVSGLSDKDRAKFGRLLASQRDRWFNDLQIVQSGLHSHTKVQTYSLVHRSGESRPRQDPQPGQSAESNSPFGQPGDVIDMNEIRRNRA